MHHGHAIESRAGSAIRWCRTLGWLGVGLIAVLSLLPKASLVRTGAPGGVEHFMAYTLTAGALGLGYACMRARVTIIVGMAGYAFLLEFAQVWVPGRMAQLRDVGASAGGAALGVAAAWLVYQLWLANLRARE